MEDGKENRRHVDTQVVSYAHKGIPGFDITGARVSSVTAKEFLEAYGSSQAPDQYYVPVSLGWLYMAQRWPRRYDPVRRNKPYSKRVTDCLMLDFRGEFPSLIEYGSLAFANMINSKNENMMRLALSHVEKGRQGTIRKRFEFLCAMNVQCLPLNPWSVQLAYQILAVFLDRHQPKANLRNTLNDMLILSTAAHNHGRLETFDGVLAKIAQEILPCRGTPNGPALTLDFSAPHSADRGLNRESKGYLNRSWAVRERKGSEPPRLW